ncbi:hypothetical protein P8V03_09925 [Clostridium sp. A1-XYC3]|uniref:HTH cro/C1-type domain-containing protein n=1 Tax=Clostridium tanneri TaxID=3037988 RepID=A0ABU4JTI7_9CLOT|nr:hypothetical protein [Clostridium sp. A1-XYC3]MDW8801472.1 hypothetical protein [Clostridium sp. A1-XYC3]
MTFNKQEFADLLEKARGDRSITRYASEVGLSPAHISRLLRKLLDTPPSPATIAKLSQLAHNGVTYKDFMIAAGHINDIENKDQISNKNLSIEKKFHQTLTPYLFSLENVKSITPPGKNLGLFTLIVDFKDGSYRRWYVAFMEAVNKNIFLNFLGHLTLNSFKTNEKITVVVTSQKEYNVVLNNKPKSLNANLYVMLIDLNSLEIIKEEVLCEN